MIRWLVAALAGMTLPILAGTGAAAQAPSGPTFDCGGAQSPLAQAICREPSAWEADWSMSSAYWAAYFSKDGADRIRLRDEHVAWLKSTEDGCRLNGADGDPGRASRCVAQRYRSRAETYRGALSGDALAEASLRPEALTAVQSRLVALGFMAGIPDGVFGAGTRQAIRAYRQTLGHPPADFLDAQERATLSRATPPGGDRRARGPFGGGDGEGRPAAPDPRFARDPFRQGQAGGVPVDPRAMLPGMIMGMLGGAAPRRPPGPTDYPERARAPDHRLDDRRDGFDGQPQHAGNRQEAARVMPPSAARPGAEFSDGDTALLASPLVARQAPETDPGVRTVEAKGTGEDADAARKDAARVAIQQVVGVFVDNRRRVELNVSDRKVSEVVDEKVISYSNAYVSKLEVLGTEQKGGLYEVTARVGVAVRPLLKVLQDNAVPVVAFDTATAASTVETLGQEKAAAVELYADLLAKADALMRIGVGTPQVDTSLPSGADEAWLRIPLTYSVNDEAAREWRAKFDLIAQKRAEVLVKDERRQSARQGCLSNLGVGFTRGYFGEQRTFLTESTPPQQLGVAACFAAYPTSEGVGAECLGRTFVTNENLGRRCPPDGPCLHLDQMGARLRLVVEFLDKEGGVVFASRQAFRSYPSLNADVSRPRPQGQERSFFNYCVAAQDPFFEVSGQYMGSPFGDVLVFPPRGSKVRGYLNLLLPNSTIARIASVRARIARDATREGSTR